MLLQLASSNKNVEQYAQSRNYTSRSSWHAAGVLIRLFGMPLEIKNLFTLSLG
jgi:hypothetical protein